MNIQESAGLIVKAMGGNENIIHVTYCMTRLRFKLRDDHIVNKKQLQQIDGVLGSVNAAGSYQVIVGKYVDSFFEAITKQLGGVQQIPIEEKKKGIISRILELVSSALSPLIPAILGAGFLSIILR